MRVLGLDGRSYSLDLGADERNRERECSTLHERARGVLANLFPVDRIHEEVHLPGCGVTLYVDFFLPLRRLAVEVQGEQHYKFSAHFHGDQAGLMRSRRRDRLKREWCEANNIQLVEFPYDEPDGEWAERVLGRFSGEAGCGP